MSSKNKNIICKYLYYFILTLFIFSLFSPLILGSNTANINMQNQNRDFQEDIKVSSFSKENYTPILEDDKYGLGNITIYNISYNEYSMGFYTNDGLYPLLTQDYNSKELNMTSEKIEFVKTSEIALVDNLNDDIPERREIVVQLNETLKVNYTNPSEGFLIYRSRLNPSRLLDFYVNEGGDTSRLTENIDYYIDSSNYLVFDYFNYFEFISDFSFSIYLIWEYNITLDDWAMSQLNEEDLMIKNQVKNFTINFNYQFKLYGRMLNDSMQRVPNEEFFAALIVNLPDKEILANHSLTLNNEDVDIEDYLNSVKEINITLTDLFFMNNSKFNLNFTAKFTLKFMDPVYQTWAIDRLVYQRNIRQRIYLPSIISGPRHIFLSSISMYELSFTIDQVMVADCLFDRSVTYFYDNNTNFAPKITLPYLIFGEICPVLIKYITKDDLRVVVLDSIKMPIQGLTVKIFYYNQSYGSYISKNQVQLLAPLKTNENGQITLKNVPRGNYTAKIYREGKLIKTSDVNTYVNVNYIYTSIYHIPIWIIVFSTINGFILIFGFLFYLRQKKRK